jgi:hypothetical protein
VSLALELLPGPRGYGTTPNATTHE